MKLEGKSTVSHESIYKFIYRDRQSGGNLYLYLRQGHRKRKHRFPSKKRQGKLKNINPIQSRPSAAENRTELGHLERDLVIGKNHQKAVMTVVDRKSRYTKLALLEGKSAVVVGKKTETILKKIISKTMTNDRGLEFADHEKTTATTGIKIYFCDPYTSQQRGTNENTNGLLRQYLPKGSDFSTLTEQDLMAIENELNSRPRKCLDWRTPYEIEWGVKVALTN
jgi:IS30 family transposase